MGSADSTCCGSGPVKPDPYNTTTKRQRNVNPMIDPLLNGDTSAIKDGETLIKDDDDEYTEKKKEKQKEKIAECISSGDITKCESLVRCIKVIKKYNAWLDIKDLTNKKKLRKMVAETINFDQYKDVNELVFENDYFQFESDADHLKHFHHYHFSEIRDYIVDNMRKKDRICDNDNCFSMKHYFSGQKTQNQLKLHRLTNLHVFLYHSMYISQLQIQHVHPRNSYLVCCYVEQKKRNFDIEIRIQDEHILCEIIHLISFYFDAKYIEDDDTLDTVSPLGLAQFIEKTMNKVTLNQVWSKLDRDGSGTIDVEEVDHILLLIVILSIATAHKESGEAKAPHIDKTELKLLMKPIGEWMKRDKMVEQPVITKEEFRDTFSAWLKEYHQTNGGIIADDKMQNEILIKYKINNNNNVDDDEKNTITDISEKINKLYAKTMKRTSSNRLVINCEYLVEHQAHKKVGKDDEEIALLHHVDVTPEPITN